MAIADDKLQSFFNKQRIGAFDALKQSGKVEKEIISHGNSQKLSVAPEENRNRSKEEQGASEQKTKINSVVKKKETVSDSLAIRTQTVSNSSQNQEETVSKPLANQEQLVSDSLAIHLKTVSKPLAKPLAKNKISTGSEESEHSINVYSSKERELIQFIFKECNANATLTTRFIGTNELLEALNVGSIRLRNIIFRSLQKGGLSIKFTKTGRDACRIFELSKSLYQSILEEMNGTPIFEVKPLAKPLANSAYSSSNINTTTELDDDWKKIDISPLKEIGFSQAQLKQLVGKNLPEVVQESINHFSFGLLNNKNTQKYKTEGSQDPLNVLMGVLRKGQAWTEKDYRSPQEIALEKMLEAKAEQKKREDELKEKLMMLDFDSWLSNLSDKEKNKITANQLPKGSSMAKNIRDRAERSVLLNHFRENVWDLSKSNE